MLPVVLCTQLGHVIANLTRMFLEFRYSQIVGWRFQGFEIRLQRRFRVDDDNFSAWKKDPHVGPESSIVGRDALLLRKITAVDHPGQFDDPLELDFTPS